MTAFNDNTEARAFIHTRLIDAPRDQVFSAFSEPARLARWWGPTGFSSTFECFELRPGGLWRFTLHGPDGADYPNESVFSEVSVPQRVVFDHIGGHHFEMSLAFEAQGSKTLVHWRQVFDTVEERERIAPIVREANEQNLDRLEAEVRRGAAS